MIPLILFFASVVIVLVTVVATVLSRRKYQESFLKAFKRNTEAVWEVFAIVLVCLFLFLYFSGALSYHDNTARSALILEGLLFLDNHDAWTQDHQTKPIPTSSGALIHLSKQSDYPDSVLTWVLYVNEEDLFKKHEWRLENDKHLAPITMSLQINEKAPLEHLVSDAKNQTAAAFMINGEKLCNSTIRSFNRSDSVRRKLSLFTP